MGKGAATVGLSASGGVASYYIVDAARAKHDPMIGHAILTTASETNSDSLLAVNFGGAESGLVLITVLLVIGMIAFKCKNCLRCCGRQKKISQKKMERAALINLAEVASALGPHIKRKTIVDQGDNKEKMVGPGKKSQPLPTIQEVDEVTHLDSGKNTKGATTHTIPLTTTTSPPPLPPTHP